MKMLEMDDHIQRERLHARVHMMKTRRDLPLISLRTVLQIFAYDRPYCNASWEISIHVNLVWPSLCADEDRDWLMGQRRRFLDLNVPPAIRLDVSVYFHDQ